MDKIFENLFVLELANNHWGSVERGLKIIHDHGDVVKKNNVKAAIKLQFRDVDNLIQQSFKGNQEIRYIKKTEATKLSKEEFAILLNEIKKVGCIAMATPFDEVSVNMCVDFDLPIIKIASSDINDWKLLEHIASTKRPVLASTGGANEAQIDAMVNLFEKHGIPLGINHCVSLYPSEDSELSLNQIDYLKKRYPGHIIGFSTHEYHDWSSSVMMSYAKGVRTWERHIDINYQGVAVSPYCSLPEQVDVWFKAFKKAVEMCGGEGDKPQETLKKEIKYLDALVRGVYAKRAIEAGYVFTEKSLEKDFYLAIPLQKGQLSGREILIGETVTSPISADAPLNIKNIKGDIVSKQISHSVILDRGL